MNLLIRFIMPIWNISKSNWIFFWSKSFWRVFLIQIFPDCIGYDSIWLTISSQMINYAQLFLDYCQTTISGSSYCYLCFFFSFHHLSFLYNEDFSQFNENVEIISSSIHSILMITLFQENVFQSRTKNYWRAEKNLIYQINKYFPQFEYLENLFYSYETKFRNFHFDEKEFSLLIFMIITRASKDSDFSLEKKDFSFNWIRSHWFWFSTTIFLDGFTIEICSNLFSIYSKSIGICFHCSSFF